jgi:putative DNA primase/helicase
MTHAQPAAQPDDITPDDALHPEEVPFDAAQAAAQTDAPDDPQAEARIAELAKLPALKYEKAREAEAKALGLRVSFLDKMVSAQRPQPVEEEAASPFADVEAWPETVNGADLLDDLQTAILRFCVLPEHSAPLMAAWALHAWSHDTADISPVLAFVSPEKRCGKTTALSVMGALTPKAMHNVNISTAVLFRVVERYTPTVLIDEGDTYLADNDELRGILNGGHNRLSAFVWRSVGDDHEPRQFNVWSPKCIAMIGKLPDTLEDRALVVRLRRKQPGETVERFRADRVNAFLPLRRKAARWAADNAITLRHAEPDVPSALNDRAQDNARHICAIADAAGGHWPETIRAALIGSAGQADDEPQSAGVLLLRDVAEVFTTRRGDRIGSTDLCEALCALEESPWGEWRGGRPISTRGIAKLLKPFGVKPAQDRAGSFYRPTNFADAFDRYLSDTPQNTATSATSATPSLSAIKKPNENNGSGTCGGCGSSESGGSYKHHSGTWEGGI